MWQGRDVSPTPLSLFPSSCFHPPHTFSDESVPRIDQLIPPLLLDALHFFRITDWISTRSPRYASALVKRSLVTAHVKMGYHDLRMDSFLRMSLEKIRSTEKKVLAKIGTCTLWS